MTHLIGDRVVARSGFLDLQSWAPSTTSGCCFRNVDQKTLNKPSLTCHMAEQLGFFSLVPPENQHFVRLIILH